jgi:serine/threonine-protein kinase
LGRFLGEGGAGHVWLAHNIDLAAPVALKLLRTDVDSSDAPDRLKREAQATARLEHPAIVRVFDCGTTELGHPFMVMELLEGNTLAEVLGKHGPMSAVAAVQILLPIVDALAMAHDKGVVHRDIKPENIFLAQEARRIQPKLVDFGIAKVEESLDRLTCAGTVLGSPSYMAPEQALGLPDVDHRADIWAVAMVLYEAVAGRAAFGEGDPGVSMRSLMTASVPPLCDDRGRETSLWWILERALRKDRGHRLDSMRTLGTELARFLLAEGVTEDVCGESVASNWNVSSATTLPGSAAMPSSAPAAEPDPTLASLSAIVTGAHGDEPHAGGENTLVSRYEPAPAAVRIPEQAPPAHQDAVVTIRVPSAPARRSRLAPTLVAAALLLIFAIASGKPARALEAAFGMGFLGSSAPAKAESITKPSAVEAAWLGAYEPAPLSTQCTPPEGHSKLPGPLADAKATE